MLVPVVVSAYLGGLWPGLICAVVGMIMMDQMLFKVVAATGIDASFLSWSATYAVLAIVINAMMEALRRSRQRSESGQRLHVSTLANIGDAIITTNPQGQIQYLNRAAIALLQRELPDSMGQQFESVVNIRDEADGADMGGLTTLARIAGATVHSGTRQVLLCPDGTRVPIEATAAPVRDKAGLVTGVVVTLRNCTGQRQIERALHERLALQVKFQQLAAVVPGAIHEFRIGADGSKQLLYASPAFNDIHGMEPELFRKDASRMLDMMHPDDTGRFRDAVTRAMDELSMLEIEYRMVIPQRGVRWLALSAMPVREADGGTLFQGLLMDVTARKQAEECMRAAQMQLQAALEAGDMGIITIDLTHETVQLDAAARRLWNLQTVTAPTLAFEQLVKVIHPDDREAFRHEYQQLRNGAQPHRAEYHLLLEDGQERWLACRGRIYVDETSGSLMKVGVVMDTTQLRRMEEQRLHSQKLEALGVLAGGIAHDFNNLLLAISGNAKLLLADLPDNDPMQSSVREIDKAAARAAELVRRILSFSSVQDLSQPHRSLPLRPVLDEVLGLARAVLPARVAISTTIPEQLPDILADASQVHQVLINLLTNAADAAIVADGMVMLEAAVLDVDESMQPLLPDLKPGRHVRITVSDRGKGIEPALLPRIFDPFFTTKPAGRGTGLGLAIVHGIMRSIEGAVTVHSSPGEGASFSLYFPVPHAAQAAVELTAGTAPAARAAHILYVDDEESLIFLMTRTLERMGHRVTACVSPEQALQQFMAGAGDFDLIVSDMAMPGMSGMELAEQVLAVRPDMPFIITSGYIDVADAERAHAIGVRQMIMKPNTVDELSAALSAILQEQGVA